MSAGQVSNNSRLNMDVHTGTHIDAPWHFIQSGATVEALELGMLIGPARVEALPEVSSITALDLETLQIPPGTERLLLQTRNSKLWSAEDSQFREDFVALTSDAAQWIVNHGIGLVGIDYLSVQRFSDGPLTHKLLLGASVIIVEGLDLSGVQPGLYELCCLPLKLVGADGAPARAVLREMNA